MIAEVIATLDNGPNANGKAAKGKDGDDKAKDGGDDKAKGDCVVTGDNVHTVGDQPQS
eukprot:EC837031.1.p5 GENE.EC837031.1~~EC837031.1.p5  ORF type:complete len:58 (-),score=19.92 EC837031.1:384-557(-)